MAFVKICGITRQIDAQFAIDAGADALGFNFYEKSKRCITKEKAKEITNSLVFNQPVLLVGIFVNMSAAKIREILLFSGLNSAQLHGDESVELCDQLADLQTIKALRIRGNINSDSIRKFSSSTNQLLFDCQPVGSTEYGGTGEKISDTLLKELKNSGHLNNNYLAGGLNPKKYWSYNQALSTPCSRRRKRS